MCENLQIFMNKTDNITEEWFTRFTGDAFVDVGGFVIDYLGKHPDFRDKTVLELIEWITGIYVNAWGGKLHNFFLNNPITQPAYDTQRKIQETIKYYKSLLYETHAGIKIGVCQISGRKGPVFRAGRDNFMLSGSFSCANFHSHFQDGVYLSKEMLIRVFFVPLGVHRLADKLCLIYSNNPKLVEFFVTQNIEKNLALLSANESKGILKSLFSNPANAIFKFIDDYQKYCSSEFTGVNQKYGSLETAIHLYHFNNLGQNVDLVLYQMDTDIFKFYTYCQDNYADEWAKFVKANANPGNYKKYFFDKVIGEWRLKDGEEVSFEDYAKWKNFVLHNLLNRLPIRWQFLNWCKTNLFPQEIISHYQKTFSEMRKDAVEKISQLADFITENNLSEDSISQLSAIISPSEMSKFIMKILKVGFSRGQVPVTMEEYSKLLFPENGSPGYWKEVRDLLLIGIYQNELKPI